MSEPIYNSSGAVGDGVADDTEALVAAMTAASEKKQPLELTPGATYLFTEVLNPKDDLTIHGNGAALLSDVISTRPITRWAATAPARSCTTSAHSRLTARPAGRKDTP